MNRLQTYPVSASVVLLGLLISGCGWLSRPKADLAFDELFLSVNAIAHEGDDEHNQWLKVCQVLNRYGPIDCDNVERTNCQQIGSIRVCDYEALHLVFEPPLDLEGLKRLHTDLMSLEAEGITLGVQYAALEATYLGLTAEGSISVRVQISVTPGATLYVERRWPGICEKVETRGNVFEDEVNLRKGQEWIYYRTDLKTGQDVVQRYFRLNVLTKKEEELNREQFDKLIKRD
jgi:hypothetical protein